MIVFHGQVNVIHIQYWVVYFSFAGRICLNKVAHTHLTLLYSVSIHITMWYLIQEDLSFVGV